MLFLVDTKTGGYKKIKYLPLEVSTSRRKIIERGIMSKKFFIYLPAKNSITSIKWILINWNSKPNKYIDSELSTYYH